MQQRQEVVEQIYYVRAMFDKTVHLGEHAAVLGAARRMSVGGAYEVGEGGETYVVGVDGVTRPTWLANMRELLALDHAAELFKGGVPRGMTCEQALDELKGLNERRRALLENMAAADGLLLQFTVRDEVSRGVYHVVWSGEHAARMVSQALSARGYTDADLANLFLLEDSEETTFMDVYYGSGREGEEGAEDVEFYDLFDIVAFYLYHQCVVPNLAQRAREDRATAAAVARDCQASLMRRDMDHIMASEFPPAACTRYQRRQFLAGVNDKF